MAGNPHLNVNHLYLCSIPLVKMEVTFISNFSLYISNHKFKNIHFREVSETQKLIKLKKIQSIMYFKHLNNYKYTDAFSRKKLSSPPVINYNHERFKMCKLYYYFKSVHFAVSLS